MAIVRLPKSIQAQIHDAVRAYIARRNDFVNLARRVSDDLIENAELKGIIHSAKFREKDPEHLRDKLERKAHEAISQKKPFTISKHNILLEIHDLAGVRLLHIYTRQMSEIHPLILKILQYHKYTLVDNPVAYTWDIENERTLSALGIRTEIRDSMYTSVHYVTQPHFSSDRCEIQVRTLAEELWGEVSHRINYPHKTPSIACNEQLMALARVASGCTRLVDSLFASLDEYSSHAKRPKK